MGKPNGSGKQDSGGGPKRGGKKDFQKKSSGGGGGGPPHRHKKVEVTFDPDARREYLTGFSTRKKERRAFGLAMQKVKDRKARLEERKENRAAQLERVEEIEKSKRGSKPDEEEDEGRDSDISDSEEGGGDAADSGERDVRTYHDEQTTQQFGGLVSVTTTYGIPSDDDDDSDDSDAEFVRRHKNGTGHVDAEQKRAGDVNKFIEELKGKMPAKKSKRDHNNNSGGGAARKGQHGAATMKGMGNASTLKAAKKTLAKFRAKSGGEQDAPGAGRNGRKRKKGKR